jgi:predicted acyltransferase
MRGATIAAMILVNNPGSWAHVHPQLRHAGWHGWTLTDLIFPFFLFIVGVAIVYSLGGVYEGSRSRLGPIVGRSARLLLFGLLLSFWGQGGLEGMRVPGVLQRIAICYLLGALTFLYVPRQRWRWLLLGLLLGYWALLAWTPVPGIGPPDLDRPEANVGAWLDRTLLGGHLWSQSESWDPEGILSTLAALATVLLGLEVGARLRSGGVTASTTGRLAAAGALLTVLGLAWDLVLPINKPLWTGSYELFTGGLAMLLLALLLWIIELRGWRRGAHPFAVFGRNAITVFVLSGFLARTAGRFGLKPAYYEALFTSWLPPDAASLAHAIVWVLFCHLVTWVMYRRGVFLRI